MSGKQITVANQPRLSLRRVAGIAADGIRYRLFRCAVTVAVISVAVAFLTNTLSEGLVKRSVSAESRRRLARLHLVHNWMSRLSDPGTIESVMADAASASPGSPSYREIAALGGFAESEMAAFRKESALATGYLRFFSELDYDRRRRFVHTANGTAIFKRLSTPEGMERFIRASGEIRSVRFVSSVDDLRAFLARWPDLGKQARAVLAGRSRAIRAIAGKMGERTVLQALSSADADFGETVRKAGFVLEPEIAAALTGQASRLLVAQRLEKSAELTPVRQLVARKLNVTPMEVTSRLLWRFLRSAANARALIGLMKEGGLSITGLEPESVAALAKTRKEQQALARAERLTSDVGKGLLGVGERMGWLLSVSMLVCAVGIANAMLISVTERFREIATLKCLGALDGFIMILFVMESCVLGAAGGVLGALLGSLIGVGRALALFSFWIPGGLPYGDLFAGMGLAVISGVILAAVAAIYPSFKAARLAPMEAMRVD